MSETNDNIPETNNLSEQFKLKVLYYNCSECKSHIEILTLNENGSTIEFKYIKKNHKVKMTIREYIDKMKKFNDKIIKTNI